MKKLIWPLILILLLPACHLGVETTVSTMPIPTVEEAAAIAAEVTSAPDIALENDPNLPISDLQSPPVPWPATTAAPGQLLVDAGQTFGRVSPYIRGSNYGPWVIVPLELHDEAEAAGITMLRWPGGEWGDRNDIQELQLDRFITFARQLGAEPSISVRLRGGTPEEAAELLRYANIEKGYAIRYWSVGNEPNLYSDYDVEQFVTEWRAIAEALLAVDPDIVLLGPEVSQYAAGEGPGPSDALLYLDRFLEVNGDLVDLVTVHRYPRGSMTLEPYGADDLLSTSPEWDLFIPDLRDRVRRLTGRDLPVGVTEINSDWTHAIFQEASPDSFYNALWLTDVLGRMVRQRVDVVNQFVLSSKDGQSALGIFADSAPRPSYYTYRLFRLFGEELVFAAVDESGGLSAYAARRDDGTLTLLLVNRAAEAAGLTLSLAGHPGGAAEVYRLTAERVTAGTAADAAETTVVADGTTINVPGYSAALLVVVE